MIKEFDSHSFFSLTPERVLAAVEASGFQCTGRCLALNSFENRVYDVELEIDERDASSRRRIVKFYRPGRWSVEQILEEHQFLIDLAQDEIPVVQPLRFLDGKTLHSIPECGILYAVFPKVGGRAPDEFSDEQLVRIGRLIARIHNVGASKKGIHRLNIHPDTYAKKNASYLQENNWIPPEFVKRYVRSIEELCQLVEPWFNGRPSLRLHGDCHKGNLLWNDQGPFFLDFDDMVNGPEVQDLWLLVPGDDRESIRQRNLLIEGYQQFRSFDYGQLRLIEPLRALRFIHYSAWIARRWKDPIFPITFPEFNTHSYWSQEVLDLENSLHRIKDFDVNQRD